MGFRFRTTLLLLLSGVSLIAAEQFASPNDSLKSALSAVSNAFMAGWEKQDMKAVALTLAPDFVYVGPEGIQSRATVLEGLPHCKLQSYSFDDVQLHQTSPKTATLIYKLHQQSSCEGNPQPPDMLATDSFVRSRNGWLLSLTTLVPIARQH